MTVWMHSRIAEGVAALLLSCACGCSTDSHKVQSQSTVPKTTSTGTVTAPKLDAALDAALDPGATVGGWHGAPLKNGGECGIPTRGKVACFGSDPQAYSALLKADAGWAVGHCPNPSDFSPAGFCNGVLVCGPLLASYAQSQGYTHAGDDPNCCFLLSDMGFCSH